MRAELETETRVLSSVTARQCQIPTEEEPEGLGASKVWIKGSKVEL